MAGDGACATTGRAVGSRSRRTCSAGSTAASGARTATRPTPRSTSAPTTAARSRSPRSRCRSGSSCSATRAWSSSWRATGRWRSSRRGSATWRRTARRSLVTRGVLNLTHRDSHEHPEPLEPGRPTRVMLELDGIAQAVPAGHRLRLALSPAYWPWLWPAPEPVTLAIDTRPERPRAAGAPAAPRGRRAAPVRGARGRRAARGRDARARRRPAHARARLHRRAHRAHLRLGHRRALPDRPRRADRGLLGLHDLLDRARRPAVGAGALPHARPSSAATAGSRAPRSARSWTATRSASASRTELEAFENGELVRRRKEWSFETPRELG